MTFLEFELDDYDCRDEPKTNRQQCIETCGREERTINNTIVWTSDTGFEQCNVVVTKNCEQCSPSKYLASN